MYEPHVYKKYSLIDENYYPGSGNNKFLSIELSFESFSYSILDSERYKYRVMESYGFQNPVSLAGYIDSIKHITKNNEHFQPGFERISLIYISPQSVFIPAVLYNEEDIDNYLVFNQIIHSDSVTCSEKLHNLDAYAIYSLPGLLKNTFNELFPGYRLRHFSTVLIESILYDIRYGGYSADIVLHVQNRHFEILVLNNNNLEFFNSFQYQTWDDLMYYLFYILEKLDIPAENMDLLIVGEASMDSELYKILNDYFRDVDFGSRSDMFKYGDSFDEIPHHYFYNLLNVNSCG